MLLLQFLAIPLDMMVATCIYSVVSEISSSMAKLPGSDYVHTALLSSLIHQEAGS